MVYARILEHLQGQRRELKRNQSDCSGNSLGNKLTFLEKMFCMEKPMVEMRALIRPSMSNEISVTVAIATPVMIGSRLRYTSVGCFSPKKRRVRTTVNSGIVALTARIARDERRERA